MSKLSSKSRLNKKRKAAHVDEEETSERELAMSKYMDLAKLSKRGKTSTGAEKIKESQDIDLSCIKLISFGRMVHSSSLNRGILDKTSPIQKIPVSLEADYKSLLASVITKVWDEKMEDDPGFTFYLADASGANINVPLKVDAGPSTSCATDFEWTLGNYMKVSGRYPSRLRLYCVMKMTEKKKEFKVLPAIRTIATKMSTTSDEGHSSRDEDQQEVQMKEIIDNHCDGKLTTDSDGGNIGSEIDVKTSETDEVLVDEISPTADLNLKYPDGFFHIQYMEIRKSRYSDKCIVSTGLTQEDILGFKLDNEFALDQKYEIQDVLVQTPDIGCHIFKDNPCHMGYELFSIISDEYQLKLIKDVNPKTGVISYMDVVEDKPFKLWTGCYSTKWDCFAVMVCVADNEYHGVATYSWLFNDVLIPEEKFAVLYENRPGMYKAVVLNTLTKENLSCCFEVKLLSDDTLIVQKVSPVAASPVVTTPIDDEIQCLSENLDSISDDVNLLDIVGRGSYGIVYRGIWRGSIVAVKVLYAKAQYYSEEVSIMQRINHPNILSIIDTVDINGSRGIITQFIKGKDLSTYLFTEKEKIEFDNETVRQMSVKICQALVFLHTNKPPIAHLDIKPANIMINEMTKVPFLTDFGLTRLVTSSMRQTNAVGTPGFQSPEQIMQKNVNEKSDVYSFGCVLIELCGKVPIWQGMSPYQIIFEVAVKGKVPEYHHLPSDMGRVCSKCLALSVDRSSSSEILMMLLKRE